MVGPSSLLESRSSILEELLLPAVEHRRLEPQLVTQSLLVEYVIDRYARKAGKRIATVDKKTLRLLESYYWPGKIRELQNVIERSVIVCETENFSVDESWLSQKLPERKAESQLYLSEKVAAQEKEIIEAALRERTVGCCREAWDRAVHAGIEFGHSRLTRIASRLSRETEDFQPIFVRTKTPGTTDR
jgi:transcriptional regulator with AAA-type ATPase domain